MRELGVTNESTDEPDANGVESFDHVIVGTGQALGTLLGGLSEGESIAVVEGGEIGGTCVNTGCTPTKALVASAKVAHQARRAREYGVRTDSVEVDFAAVMERVNTMRHSSRDGLTEWLESSDNLTLIRGWARFVGPRTLRVGERVIRGDRVYLNVGARARVPDVAELDEIDWLDNARLLNLQAAPEHLLVLGAGYVGLEFAQIFARFGSRVTVLASRDQVLPREDPDVAVAAQEALAHEGVRFEMGARAKRVARSEAGGVEVLVGGDTGERWLRGSHLLVATGRVPNGDGLDLARGGVETDERGYVRVDDELRTSAEGVFALGDVNGHGAFTHTSVNDAEIVLDVMHGGPRRLSHRNAVYAIFIDPPLGRVGLNEREALASGKRVHRATRTMKRISRAREMGETTGLVKILVDADSELFLGATILGVGGDEIIGVFATAMNAGMTWREFRTTVLPHPTVTELMPFTLDDLEPL